MQDAAQVMTLQTLMAEFLENDLSIESLRTHTLLRKDEWKAYDDAVVDVARQRLNGIADLQARGLTRDLGGLGTMIDEWEASSDMTDANVDMAGVTPGEEDSVAYTLQGVPIPIVHKDYRINIRRLLASRKNGRSVDTTQAEVATRKVRDQLEEMLFNGVTVKAGGYSIYGYTTFPQRTQTVINGAWDTTPANCIADVEEMLADMDALFHFGPFILYLPTNFWSAMRGDRSTYYEQTYLARLLAYAEIEAVKPADVLSSDEVVMVEAVRDVVDLAVGQDIANVEWQTQGGLVQHMKIMAAMAPRLKYDANSTSGVCHGTETS